MLFPDFSIGVVTPDAELAIERRSTMQSTLTFCKVVDTTIAYNDRSYVKADRSKRMTSAMREQIYGSGR